MSAADPLSRSAASPPLPGRFLVLEGIDGCGKTTQLEALRQWLPGSGLMPAGARLLVSREPGGTALGQALRSLLLHPPEAAAPCPTAELLLYAADRAQHVAATIRPALEAGDWVLCDRFAGSTAAYQGYGRGLSLALIEQLEAIATDGLRADLTLWLDLPLALSLQRRQGRAADRIEASGEAFLARVCAGFGQLAAQRGWQTIDATAPAPAVTAACCQRIQAQLGGDGADGLPESWGGAAAAPQFPLDSLPPISPGGVQSAPGRGTRPPQAASAVAAGAEEAVVDPLPPPPRPVAEVAAAVLESAAEASSRSPDFAARPSLASPPFGVEGSWGPPQGGA